MKFWDLSRRKLLAGIGAVSAGVMLGGAGKSSGPRALALIGDRYHNADYIRLSLNRVFGELGIPIDYTIDTSAISPLSIAEQCSTACMRIDTAPQKPPQPVNSSRWCQLPTGRRSSKRTCGAT